MGHPANHFSLHSIMTRKRATKTIDSMAYFVGVAGNIAVVPQIIRAWQSDAPGLAITTWVLFTLIGFIWLAYAILHRQKPLIVAQTIAICCNFLVVLGWAVNHWLK